MKKTKLLSIVLFLSVAIFLAACVPLKNNKNDNNTGQEDVNPAIEYSITFEPENGEKNFIFTYKKGESFVFPTTPVRQGYIFNGWYLDNMSFEVRFNSDYIETVGIEENLIVFSKWVIENIEDTPGAHLILSMINNSKLLVDNGSMVVDYEMSFPKYLIDFEDEQGIIYNAIGRLIVGFDKDAKEEDSGIVFSDTAFEKNNQTAAKTLDELWNQKEGYSYSQVDLFRDILNLNINNGQSLNKFQTLLSITNLSDFINLEGLLFMSPRALEDELEINSEEWYETTEMYEEAILNYTYDKARKVLNITLSEELMDISINIIIDLNTMNITAINYEFDMEGTIYTLKTKFRLGSDIRFEPPVEDSKIQIGLEDCVSIMLEEIVDNGRIGFGIMQLVAVLNYIFN